MTTALDFDLFDSVEVAAPVVVPEAPTPAQAPVVDASHTMTPDDEWDWEDMRNFCMSEMERYHGPQVRNPIKEKSIFGSFVSRHGSANSAAIARFAFGFCKGMWNSAPISINRFCKASDQYFADQIKQRLSL